MATYEMKKTEKDYIYSYKTKNGDIKFMFRLNLGKDKKTQKPKNTTGRGFDTISEAVDAREHTKARFEARKNSSKENPVLFRDLADQWLDEYQSGDIEPSTFAKTSGLLRNHIIPIMGDLDFRFITPLDCKRCIREFSKRIKKFENLTTYASQILHHAVLAGYITVNPFSTLVKSDKTGVKQHSKTQSEPVQEKRSYFLPEEVNSLLDFLEAEGNLKSYAFYRLLTYTGCRRGEVFALTWKDIDFVNKKVTINKAIGYAGSSKNKEALINYPQPSGNYLKGTKNGISRCLALDDKTLSILKEWQAKQKELLKIFNLRHKSSKQLVFQNKYNTFTNCNKASIWLNKAKASLPFVKYVNLCSKSLRHTYATLCASNGISLVDIQHRLGHVGSDTASRYYIHPTEESDRRMCETYVRILDDARKNV